MTARPQFLSLLSLVCAIGMVSGTLCHAQSGEAETAFVSPEKGGPRRFVVATDLAQAFDAPSKSGEVVAEFANGAVLSNLGCMAGEGKVWCMVEQFGGRERGYVEASQVVPAPGPDGQIGSGPDTSKARAKAKDFDARAEISCAQEQGQTLGRCASAIARSGGGDSTVVVTFPNGFARQLYFTHGAFMRGSATMSGTGSDVDWSLENGTYVIRVDDQKFAIPEAYLLGE